MRSASANTASMSCSIKSIVSSRLSSRSMFTMRALSSGPSPAIGSSSSSMRGLVARVIAISSWRCSPWLRLATSISARAASPTRASAARAQFRLLACGAPEMKAVPGMRLDGERDILDGGEIEKQRSDLERAVEAQLTAAKDRQAGNVAARKANAPGVGRDLAGELSDQRGLAGAVWSDDCVQLA